MSRKSRKHPRSSPAPPAPSPPAPVVKHPDAFPATPKSRWKIAIICVCLAAATLAVYARVGSYPFIDLDDPALVYDNAYVKDGFAPGSIAWAFTDTRVFYWQPLTWLSHMLDCQLFGLNAGAHHLENAGLHAVNAILLFLLLLHVTGMPWRSGLAAALFALHPLRVESVAWVAERRDVLCGLFSLLTLWAYVRYAERTTSWKRYAAVVVTFCLALLSKPMAISVPFVMLLLDHWPLNRFTHTPARKLVLEKLPLFACAAASAIITAVGSSGQTIPLSVLPVRARIASAAAAYLEYLGKFAWPRSLGAFYPHHTPGAGTLIIAGLVLVLLTLLAVRYRRRTPYFLTGWLWFLVMLVPVIGLVQSGGQYMADRFTYLPLIGPVIALVWFAADTARSRPILRRAAVGLAFAALLIWGGLSWRQVGYWSDKFSVYRRAIEVTGRNERMWYFYGQSLERDRHLDEAAECYRQAIRLEPNRGDDREALALLLMKQGKPQEAIAEFRQVIRVEPENLHVLRYLATVLIQTGSMAEAAGYLQKAALLAPNDPNIKALQNVASLLSPPNAAAPDVAVANAPPEVRPDMDTGWRPLTRDEALELGIVLGFLVFALGWPHWGKRLFGRAESALARLAQKPVRAMAVAALVPMAVRLLWLPVYPIPEPVIHDEFGYLLLGNTFASGRLANPPHPMREHFESIYIIQNPTYASYYPAGQGMLLATAIILNVSPWFAVWLSVGLMCAALYWMLSGWLPPRWALLGALLAGARFGVLSHWMNSYWGGAVPAIGGALVFGSLPRIYRGKGAPYAVLLGLGIGVLMHTRPYEGALISIPVGMALLVWLLRTKTLSWRKRIVTVVLPLAAVVLCGAAFTAYYNWRVTGQPWEMPYRLYQKEYGVPQAFYWQQPYPPGKSLRLPELEQTYRWQLDAYNARHSWRTLAKAAVAKLGSFWRFYFGPLWTLPLLVLPWLWGRRRLRFLLLTGVFVLAGVGLYPFFFPHYVAPICGLLIGAVVEGIRRLQLWEWRGRPIGAGLARVVVAASATAVILAPAGDQLMSGDRLVHKHTPRQRVIAALEARAGKDLIFVHYGPHHSFHNSLVQNDADIDNARIVWARDLGPAKNQELVHYFSGRTTWYFDADQWPVHLTPYESGGPVKEAGLR